MAIFQIETNGVGYNLYEIKADSIQEAEKIAENGGLNSATFVRCKLDRGEIRRVTNIDSLPFRKNKFAHEFD